ncbi:MAG: sugar-binding domain-containing protein [Terracidiphilus sp.]
MHRRLTRIAFLFVIGAALFAVSSRAARPRAPRQQLSADAGWKFQSGDPAGAEKPAYDDAAWRSVDLPHDWSIEAPADEKNPSGTGGGFAPTGIGWYRRTFTAPASWQGRQVTVEFDGVAQNATVYLNGEKLGIHPYAYTSFRFDLTPHLKVGAANVLAVRVDTSEQPASRWYTGSGIYRHVRIVVTEPVHVAPWGVFVSTAELTDSGAKVLVKTEMENSSAAAAELTVKTTLLDSAGKRVAESQTAVQVAAGQKQETAQTLALAHPAPWSPEHPSLYRALTQVLAGSRVVDELETTFGVRSIQWSVEKGLLLNGVSIKLAGGSVHHDNGPLGAAAFDRAEERRVELLKGAGFNAVRTAHNPPSPAFLSACDHLGLIVLDEAFDVWITHKTTYDYSRFFNDWWQRDLDSMVLRDRNHPSILIWSIGNEIPDVWTGAGTPIASKLAARVRALDTTRPLTEAFPGATFGPNPDAVMANLDIAGYNYNVTQNGPKDHARVPGRIMMTTESFPAAAFDQWQQVHQHSWILGEFVWTAIDYLGESGIGAWSYATPEQAKQVEAVSKMASGMMSNMGADGKNPFEAFEPKKDQKPDPMAQLIQHGFPWHAAYCGDIDLTGFRKPQSWYRDILWNGGDRVYATVRLPEPEGKKIIAAFWAVYPTLPNWTWPGLEGKELQVEVYAGTEKVRLYLNGKLLGEKPTGTGQERKAVFTVPYAPGTLKAAGVNSDREVAASLIETAGAPAKLHLEADRKQLRADGEDLAFVMVELEDAAGRLEQNASDEVKFSLSGPGSIVAVGNGDGQSSESYQGDHRRLFNGRALVVVRTSHAGGTIQLTATAAGLPTAEVTLRSEAARGLEELGK